MVIRQGDIYWIELEEPSGSEHGYSHPHVIVQNNIFNRSCIHTVVMCALTSNLKRGTAPGNVLLEEGEGNLSKKSVVVVSQIFTVDKSQLGEYVGTLSRKHVGEIVQGIRLLVTPSEVD
jgi:mRNA interferase MazF